MDNLYFRANKTQNKWRPLWTVVILSGIGLIAGTLLASIPLLWACIGLLTAVLLIATLIEPLVGLSVALILGPTKPLTDYFVPHLPLDLGQIALIITLGSWFIHAARQRKIDIPTSKLTIPLLVFLGAALLSLLNALSLGYALKEMIKWGQLLLSMWLVIDLVEKKKQKTLWVMLGAVFTAGLAQALIGIWQFGLRGDGPEHFLILDERFYRAYGTFEQPNPYGGFLGLILPVGIGLSLIALERWFTPVWQVLSQSRPVNMRNILPTLFNQQIWKLFLWGSVSVVLALALLMSWSRGAWLGVGAAGIAILFAWPRKAWFGLLLVAGSLSAGFLLLEFNLLPAAIASRLTGFTAFLQTFDVRGVDITPANYAVLERLAHWQAAQEMARFKFWFGVGFGNYEPAYPAYALINWPQPLGHAHNYYLNLLAETGVVGILAYAVLWISIFWQTWQLTRQSTGWQRGIALGLFGTWTHLAVHQLVDKLYVANLHLHIGVMLGILCVLNRNLSENN